MTQNRYIELEQRSKGDLMQLVYELYSDEKGVIPREQFDQLFLFWLNMIGNKSLVQCIEYFKQHKIK